MVASSLALAFLLLLSAMPPLGEAKKCSDEGVLDWTADSCIYEVNTPVEYVTARRMYTVCRALVENDNGSKHEWHVPKLDSIEKQKILYGIIRRNKKIVPEGTVLWINLEREYPNGNESWSDPTKWFWIDRTGGKKRLDKVFKGDKLPWAEMQPDNAAGVGTDPNDLLIVEMHMERCVVAKMKPASPWFEWFDESCYKDGKDEWNESFRLLCEGYKIPPPNANDSNLANLFTTTSSATTTQHPLVWIIVGLILVIVLISTITVAVACKERIRRCKKSIGMTWHRSWGNQSFNRFWSDETNLPTGSSTDRRRVRRSKPNDQLKKKQVDEDKDKLEKAQV